MTKVYIAGAIPEVGLNLLKEHFEVDMYDGEGLIDKETLKKGVEHADALISLLSTSVDKDIIDSANNLKIIANYGAGFNNIDVEYARQQNIDVTNTPHASTNATADLTIGLILSVARRIVEGDHLSRTTGFDGWAPLFFRGREVSGKTIGIIGLGEIGGAVAKRARAFDMDVLYTYLINAGRGPIVNEQSLVEALDNKAIEGAALDVYEFEPEITDALKSFKNVVLTPHIGNATFEARDMMAKIVANDTIKKLNGDEPQFIVN